MLYRTKWLTLAAAAAAAVLLSGEIPPLGAPLQAQQPKAAPKKAAARKPSRKQAAQHLFKVQARSPQWRVIPAANRPAAQAVARTLKRQGWTAQVKAKQGRVYVRAKMTRWRTRAVAPNRPQAARLASVLRAQRFQARVVQVK